MKLSVLLAEMEIETPEIEVSGLSLDSRWIAPGDAFVALCGAEKYLEEAAARGAVAVLSEVPLTVDAPLPVIVVHQLRRHMGELAGRFYGHPDRDLKLIAITGTDGKTSTSHYIAEALEEIGCRCAVIGTFGAGWPDGQIAEGNALTTPDIITLHRMLARLRSQGARAVAIEASSHGLSQGRLDGLDIDIAVLTHLSRDHLDYHGSHEAYAAAKRRLFERPELRVAVLNQDSDFGRECHGVLGAGMRAISYSVSNAADASICGEVVRSDRHGLVLDISYQGRSVRLAAAVTGVFNAQNLLASLGALLGLGVDFEQAVQALEKVRPVPGRMEIFSIPNGPLTALDYAHTPNALEAVLKDFRNYVPGRIWCVMGVMGNRDRGKRPLMAAVAARWSDRIILTDSLTHGEDPSVIIEDLCRGLPSGTVAEVIRSRSAAIAHALHSAGPDDGVLIAGTGKGNERVSINLNGQIVASDYACLNACLGSVV